MASEQLPILIIGAGISGLTFAQACRKDNIPFRIFERDQTSDSRSAGWGLTLNWALPAFRALLPEDILARLPLTYVNHEAVDAGQKGNFTFYDLSTGEAKWKVPAAERIRVSRERLRKVMLSKLEVEWGKNLEHISHGEDSVTAVFADGSSTKGSLLIACDGSRSVARRLLHTEKSGNYELSIRMVGAGVQYVESCVSKMLDLDPYFLQGSDPKTDVFFWFSILETPGDRGAPLANDSMQNQYRCQIMMSWPYREGFFGRADPSDVPNTTRGMLIWMKTLSADWAEPFHSIVQNISAESEIKPVELTDWLPQRTSGLDQGSRVVLVGDAAHAMVMYRGEGANHAIVDVSVLLEKIRPLYQTDDGTVTTGKLADALKEYENEMVDRAEVAVLASRQACMDAHDYKRLNDKSPLVRRRLMRADLEDVQK